MIDVLSWFCFLAGGFLCITGGVGLLRFPDFFTRVHAAGVAETLAAPLALGGLILQTDWSLDTAKILLIMAFVLATNPTATHAMARAALHGSHGPRVLGDLEDSEAQESGTDAPERTD